LTLKRRKRFFHTLRVRWKAHKALRRWEREGRPVPPPHIVKQLAVKSYANDFGFKALVETGTYHGEMVEAMRRDFDRLYSIEIDKALYERARADFSPFGHIRILRGDSGEVLPALLSDVHESCLFWLDGHYSGAGTGRGMFDTPVLKELTHIFHHPVRNHVILIDDARDFTGEKNYPSLERLREFVREFRPDWSFEVKDDIVRIHPPRPERSRAG
jgi:hypothetical protein